MQIAEQVGDAKSPEDCETLFRQHQGYLSLNVEYHSDVVFATMVHDHFNAVPQKVSENPGAGSGLPRARAMAATRHALVFRTPVCPALWQRLQLSDCPMCKGGISGSWMFACQQASSQVTAEGGATGGSLVSGGSSAPPSAAKGRRTPRPGFRVSAN